MRRKKDVQPSQKAGDSGLNSAKGTRAVRVRAISLPDFKFVRRLSATIQGYTVPPPYILWMLTRFQADLCLIVEDGSQEPLGYMLAMSAGIASSEIFVWQFAINYRGQRLRAGNALARHVRELVKKHGIELITFTAVPVSPGTKGIASLAKQMFGHIARIGTPLPSSISATEREFHLVP